MPVEQRLKQIRIRAGAILQRHDCGGERDRVGVRDPSERCDQVSRRSPGCRFPLVRAAGVRDKRPAKVHDAGASPRAAEFIMIRKAAEAFLAAIEAQARDRAPPPKVYREPGELRDVQIVGQIDILAAMTAGVAALRIASDQMEEAGSAQVDQSRHVEVDGIWTAMMDAALRPGSAD
jgi:hypothetical protein